MVPAWLSITLAALTAVSVALGLIGVIARYVMWPWIKEQLGPLANGFAGDVLAGIADLKAADARIEKDIGGIREELRQERSERSADIRRLQSQHDKLAQALEAIQ